MNNLSPNKIIEFGISAMILPGQSESGDLYIVKETEKQVLIGVVDGLGHGSEAANAAKLAVSVLNNYAHESVIALTKFCHDKLKSTRGVVMALVTINPADETLTWLSIGNVEGMLLRSDPHLTPSNPVYESIITRPGVVGYRLPTLYASVISITKGDLIILSTDGINDDYIHLLALDARHAYEQLTRSGERSSEELLSEAEHYQAEIDHGTFKQYSDESNYLKSNHLRKSPQELADHLCKRFNKGNDDALVVVVKYI